MLNLKDGIHAVILHGHLEDIRFISENLGIDLELPVLNFESSFHVKASVYRNPSFFWGSGISYNVTYDSTTNLTRVDFQFKFRNNCANLEGWGKEWNLPVTSDRITDGGGESSEIRAANRNGIDFIVSRYTWGGCEGFFRQQESGPLLFTKLMMEEKRTSPDLSKPIVDILENGDLRNYEASAKALGVSMIPSTANQNPLNRGSVELVNVVPGILSSGFSYYADDTGWMQDPIWFKTPQHLAERFVDMGFAIDTRQVCQTTASVTSELERRSIKYRASLKSTGELDIVKDGENLITIKIFTNDGCITGVSFHQTSDFSNNLPLPIILYLDESFATNADQLTHGAIKKLDILTHRVDVPILSKIDIYQNLTGINTAANSTKTNRLSLAIRDYLVAHGVQTEKINIHQEPHQFDWLQIQQRPEYYREGVYIDAIAD
jgi:hypothetical protein